MKRLLIPIAAAGLFASCVQTETIAPEVGEVQKDVRFNAVVAKKTSRAIITGTDYDKDAPTFGTYAFLNPSTTDLLPGYERYITNEEIGYHDDGTTQFWAPKDPAISYKWPESGSLTFYSYSPYNFQEVLKDDSGADIPANTVPLNPETPRIGQHGFIFRDYNVNDHQETDLMVADIVYGRTANEELGGYDGVPTLFRHKLALFGGVVLGTTKDYDGNWDGINMGTAQPGNLRFKIKRVSVKNIPVVGTFTSEGITGVSPVEKKAESWVLASGDAAKTADYVWFNSGEVDVDGDGDVEVDGVEFGFAQAKQLHIYTMKDQNGYKVVMPTNTHPYILAIPQEFTNTDASIEITYTIETLVEDDNGSKSWSTPSEHTKTILLSNIHNGKDFKGWGMNKLIRYRFLFSTEEIRWAPEIADGWVMEDFNVDL